MSWISPFALAGCWYKGNLHTHTTQSDGRFSPEEAIAYYRERGYDFLALTDHWVLTRGRTFAPATDFITLSGVELHTDAYHMVALGPSALPKEELKDSPQAMAEQVVASGGLAFIAHPYWTGQSASEIAPLASIAGIEVFNSTCAKGDGRGYSSAHWDELLAQGHRLWGLAVDDTHWRGDQGQAFVMVRAPQLEERAILTALARGDFYASTGPTINDLRVVTGQDGKLALRVHCSPCASITFFAWGPRAGRFVAPAGELLQSARLPIRPEQVYLRVECQDEQGRTAWSQAVFVKDILGG